MKNSKTVQLLDKHHWQYRLQELTVKHNVPGAVFGILRADIAQHGNGTEERVVVAAGITNVNTGQAVTADTLFQIGSITKTWTATMVLQLVGEGKLDLDAPVRDVLPDFALSDESAAATVTMRHLLTHTSGIDGDIFTDTGRGDDCVQKFVVSLKTAKQLFAPGASWSYCNTGFVIAGRVVEVLREMSWDEALAKFILAPLSLKETTTLPEQTAMYRFAVGHQIDNGVPVLSASFLLPRSIGPAGIITASADDLLTYARTFMPGGKNLLDSQLLAQMLSPQVSLDYCPDVADHMGLGWALQDWDGIQTIKHNGGTLGQKSAVRIFPDQGVVLFLSINGGDSQKIQSELLAEAAAVIAGATMPAAFIPSSSGCDHASLNKFEGVYEAAGVRIGIQHAEEGNAGSPWRAVVSDTSGMFGDQEPDIFELVGNGPTEFAAAVPGTSEWLPLCFETLGDTRLLHFNSRCYPQTTSADS